MNRAFYRLSSLGIVSLGVLIGQSIEMMAYPGVLIASVWLAVSLLLRRGALLACAVLCGAFQCSLIPNPLTLPSHSSARDVRGVLSIYSHLAFDRAGAVRFQGEFRREGATEASRLFCSAKSVPWRNQIAKGGGRDIPVLIRLSPVRSGEWGRRVLRRGGRGRCKVLFISSDKGRTALGTSTLQSFRHETKKYLPQSQYGAIIRAMVFGERAGLPKRVGELCQIWGIMHLLVVSGLHVGALYFSIQVLTGLAIGKFVRELQLFFVYRYLPDILGISLVWAYVALLEFPISATRASIAVTIYVLSGWIGVATSFLDRTLVAALLVVSIWPGVFEEMGFQLTFSALFGIYFASLPRRSNRFSKFLLFTIFPSAFTSVVSYLHTGSAGALTLVGNLIFAPLLVGIGFYGGLSGFVVSLISERGGNMLYAVVEKLLRSLFLLIDWLSMNLQVRSFGYSLEVLLGLAAWCAAFCYLIWCFQKDES